MKNSKSIIGLIVLAVVLVAAGVTLGMNWHSWFGGDTPAAQTADKLQVDPNAGDYVAPEPEEQSEGIAIPGWGSISLPAGKTAVSVDFANPDANADKYYLSFELRLKDTGEVLCTTGLVPPGQNDPKYHPGPRLGCRRISRRRPCPALHHGRRADRHQ